ncbi:DUF5666 domain-containing protein [Paenarthrobacter sp. NyZ202]|uniref:DUF5666 domain-containing protein n=1 Tax=Paenarthrobacter sp. NyZ202 TaxID=3402689 RepID=UPI003CE9D98E
MATLSPGLRKALLAGGIAVAVTAGGTAAVWAGTQPSPSPSGTSASPGPSETRGNGNAPPKSTAKRGQALHGEHVVKDADGTFRTLVTQRGTIESVNSTDITVTSEDGFTQRYAITSDTKISMVPADTVRPRNGRGNPGLPSATAAELKTGDTVQVSGTRNGGTASATRIIAGDLDALRGQGHKRGHGPK